MTDTFIGRSLGKYTVESKLGQGGMGMVYLGRQRSLNRSVAIKVLPALMAMDEDFVQRFRQEAQVIAGLQHENIVHVYDIDKTEAESGESIYFIVMEFVDGFNLRQRPDRDQPMTWQRVRAVGLPLARALDYAHRRGIVHRDIKPANVMQTKDGKIKLMDFGIAKSAGGVKTVTGSVLGTPEYMAPEQAQSGLVTPQTDIYALGVLLYEMAAGRLPFEAGEPFAIALKHISEQPVPPSHHVPSIPPWLERVILRAMEKKPADRFADAGALAHALERAGADPASSPSSVQTDRPGPSVLPFDLAPTLRAPSSVDLSGFDPAAPTLQTPASGLAGAPPPPPPPPRSAPTDLPTGPQTASRRPVAWWPVAAIVGALALIAAAAVGYFVLGPESGGDGSADGGADPTLSATAAADQDLVAAETALAAGDLDAARRLVDAYLTLHPADPPGAELERRLDHAERSRAQALAAGDLLVEIDGAPSELADAQPTDEPARDSSDGSGMDAATAKDASDAKLGQAGAPDSDLESNSGAELPERSQRAQATPPEVPLRQLVQRARQHRAREEFHSLRQVIQQIRARDRQGGRLDDELESWARKVDGWARDRDSELKEAVSDLLDDFAEIVEDEDMEDMEELWGDRIDPGTAGFFRQYFETYRKAKAEIDLRSVQPWDHEAEFEAVVRLYGRTGRSGSPSLVRTVTWRGKLSDRDGVRMISPFPG